MKGKGIKKKETVKRQKKAQNSQYIMINEDKRKQ